MEEKVYLVSIYWNYPTESGNEVIGIYKNYNDAKKAAKKEISNEKPNFISIVGEYYSNHHFRLGEIETYWLKNTAEDIYFSSALAEYKLQ